MYLFVLFLIMKLKVATFFMAHSVELTQLTEREETFIASTYKMYSFSGFVNCASVASICMNQHDFTIQSQFTKAAAMHDSKIKLHTMKRRHMFKPNSS